MSVEPEELQFVDVEPEELLSVDQLNALVARHDSEQGRWEAELEKRKEIERQERFLQLRQEIQKAVSENAEIISGLLMSFLKAAPTELRKRATEGERKINSAEFELLRETTRDVEKMCEDAIRYGLPGSNRIFCTAEEIRALPAFKEIEAFCNNGGLICALKSAVHHYSGYSGPRASFPGGVYTRWRVEVAIPSTTRDTSVGSTPI